VPNNGASVRLLLIGAALGAIVGAAVVLRFADLAVNPGGLFVDEAAEALSAQRLLHEPGFHPVFFADGGGREALFAYLLAAGFKLFGESVLVLRAVAAAIGVAAVLAIWRLARRFGIVAGLVAAAWAAGSLWLTSVSRDGMRNTLVPLFGALSLAAVLAWQERPTRVSAALAGAATSAAALYTYQPLKLMPLLLIAWLAWLARTNRPAYLRVRPTFGVLAASFLLVGAPMIVAAIADPASYFGRAVGVSLLGNQGADLAGHWLRTLGMFTIAGDPNPRHNVGALPMLGWPIFAVALVGVLRLWARRHEPAHALILWSLPVFLLPPLLATEGGAPHFLRALGLAAPLAVAIGLGVAELSEQAGLRWGRRAAWMVTAAASVGLLALAVGSGNAYLSRPVADRYEAYGYDLVAMANTAREGDVVILDAYSAGVIRFLDAGRLPQIVEPGTPLRQRSSTAAVLARSLADLEAGVGTEAVGQAEVVAGDPNGVPSIWRLPP
jgi:4-amino-4-deoxy-L-arabinose transferase-like glycosyltransferase